MASNFKANIDEAFLRRFNAIVQFPFPNQTEREAIWRISLPSNIKYKGGIDLPKILSKFELTGGNIINIVQYACIKTIARGTDTLCLEDALKGIQREVEKEGKVFRNIIEEHVD
ncbi:hypothetical protein ACFLZW_07455 [Chloroflexota bacterium]